MREHLLFSRTLLIILDEAEELHFPTATSLPLEVYAEEIKSMHPEKCKVQQLLEESYSKSLIQRFISSAEMERGRKEKKREAFF